MLFKSLEPIDTNRLQLRLLTLEDVDVIEKTRGFSTEQAMEFTKKLVDGINNNQWIYWVIYLKDSNEKVGSFTLWNFSEDQTTCEIGYGLYPEYQKNGYMLEVINTIIEYSFIELSLTKIECYTSSLNKDSLQLLSNTSFIKVDEVVEENVDTKETELFYIYAIEKHI